MNIILLFYNRSVPWYLQFWKHVFTNKKIREKRSLIESLIKDFTVLGLQITEEGILRD